MESGVIAKREFWLRMDATPHHFLKSVEAEENKRVAAFFQRPICAKSAQAIEKKGGYKIAKKPGLVLGDCFGAYVHCHSLDSLYEYQRKGDAGEAVCMSIKTKGIENARRGGLFELVSITHSEYNRVFTKSQSKYGVY